MDNVVDKSTTLGFQAVNTATNLLSAFTNAAVSSLKMASERDQAARLLFDELKHNKDLDIVYCSKDDSKVLAAKIKEQGIPCVAGVHTTKDRITKQIEEKPFIIFPENELETVRGIINNFKLEHNYGAVSTEELLYSGGAIRCINGLDYKNSKLFLEHCENIGIAVNMKEISENKFNIYYSEKDKDAIDSIKMTVSIELSGKAGQALSKQLEYENANYNRITSRILQEKDDFEVVDLHNHRISVSRSGVTFYDNNKKVFLDRNSLTFNDDVCKVMAVMKNPVDLSVVAFNQQQYLDKKKKKDFLYEKDRKNGRPELSKEEYEAIKKISENHQLYEKKIALENPVQQLYEYSYANNEMRMATFEAYEEINKTEEKEDIAAENRTLDAEDKAILDDAKESFRDFNDSYVETDSLRSQDDLDELLKEADLEKDFLDYNLNGIDDSVENIEYELD